MTAWHRRSPDSARPLPEPAESPEIEHAECATAEATAAFEALVRMHYTRLARFAYRFVKSWDIAEDAVQDALYKTWKRRTAINYHDPLPYLYQAVRNECLMVLRRQRRWDTDSRVSADTLPAAADDRQDDLRAAVDRAVDALPPRTRLVFTMSREQGHTYTEIARILGISIKTVETQMGRALRGLRRTLAPYLSVVLTII